MTVPVTPVNFYTLAAGQTHRWTNEAVPDAGGTIAYWDWLKLAQYAVIALGGRMPISGANVNIVGHSDGTLGFTGTQLTIANGTGAKSNTELSVIINDGGNAVALKNIRLLPTGTVVIHA